MKKSAFQVHFSASVECAACRTRNSAPIWFIESIFGYFTCKQCNATNRLKCDHMKELLEFRKFCIAGAARATQICNCEAVLMTPEEVDEIVDKNREEEMIRLDQWGDLPPDKSIKGLS